MSIRSSRRIGSKVDVRSTLRSLLRLTRSRGSTPQPIRSSIFAQHILGKYRENQHVQDREEIKLLRTMASNMLHLYQSIDEQKLLRTMDAGAEKRFTSEEMVSKSARRVGLQIPEEYSEDTIRNNA